MPSPLVSIITPSYNQENVIREAAESVLAQTYQNWEWIVIDDGSTDNTVDVIREYLIKDPRIQLIQTWNHGSGDDTRMIPTTFCRGDYVTFLDGDDKLFPKSLETRVTYLEQHPDKIGVGAGYQYGETPYNIEASQFTMEYFLQGYLTRAVWPYMYRREVFQTLTFKPFGLYGDAIVTFEIVKHYEGRVAFIPDILYDYRCSPQGASFNVDRVQQRIDVTLKTLEYYVNDDKAFPTYWPNIRHYIGHAIFWELDNIRISFPHRQAYGYMGFFKAQYFKKTYFTRKVVWPHAIRNMAKKSQLRGRFYTGQAPASHHVEAVVLQGPIQPTLPPKIMSSAVRQGGQRTRSQNAFQAQLQQ